MTIIELTDDQRRALQAKPGKPVDVVDPTTQQRYVLLAHEQYERVRSLLDQPSGSPVPLEPSSEIPSGILRSQQAFWRDLPKLLNNKRNRGKWVCYHGDERVGIADSDEPLLRECLRRALPDDAYCLFEIRARTFSPWEAEEIVPMKPIHHGTVFPAQETSISGVPPCPQS